MSYTRNYKDHTCFTIGELKPATSLRNTSPSRSEFSASFSSFKPNNIRKPSQNNIIFSWVCNCIYYSVPFLLYSLIHIIQASVSSRGDVLWVYIYDTTQVASDLPVAQREPPRRQHKPRDCRRMSIRVLQDGCRA